MSARISLCMIVKNEEAVLATCLAAAKPWVDELVVVDTGSTDRTREIAAHHGAQVIEWAWRDDFAAARNESLRHATGDWILALDADEVMTPESGPSLRRACDDAGDIVAYDIKIVCPRDGDGGLVRLNWFPRLFRNLPGVQWQGVIHEQVVESLAGRGRVERSTVEVLHSGYTLSHDEMIAKGRRNVGLLAKQLREEPDYAPGWFQLAETYVYLGQIDEAIDAYRRCLRLLQTSRLTLSPVAAAIALQNLGATLLHRGDKEEGVEMLQAALLVEPQLAPVYVHLGNAALGEQAWEDAERHFAKALSAAEATADRGEYQISPWLIHFLRGCAQGRQQKYADAIASFEASVGLNGKNADALWLLALTAANNNDAPRSLDALERLGRLGRDDFPFHAQRAQMLGALGRIDEAAAAAERAVAAAPRDGVALALAAHCLMRAAKHAEAGAMYARLAEVTPDVGGPLLGLAQCREASGDRAGMMDAYRRAVAVEPESADVLFALGSACLRAGALAEAEECLAAAVERQPGRPDIRLNHALCLLKLGAIEETATMTHAILDRWPDYKAAHELRAILERVAVLPVATAGSPA